MADVFSKEKRSEIMSKISGRETKPEVLVRKYLFSKGFRYRKNPQNLFGKPDIVLAKYRTVILIHGCFWHHHLNCKAAVFPSTNVQFWENKLRRTIKRDKLVKKTLRQMGWNVLIVWQCKIKNRSSFTKRMNALIASIRAD